MHFGLNAYYISCNPGLSLYLTFYTARFTLSFVLPIWALFCVWEIKRTILAVLSRVSLSFILSVSLSLTPAFTALELHSRLEMINVNRCPSLPFEFGERASEREWEIECASEREPNAKCDQLYLETAHNVYEQWLEICLATSPNFISLHYNSWVLTKHINASRHIRIHIHTRGANEAPNEAREPKQIRAKK